MITIHFSALIIFSLVVGYLLARLAFYGLTLVVRDGGPLSESACPLCKRPHDSEARQLRRWLDKSHENTDRLLAENQKLAVVVAFYCASNCRRAFRSSVDEEDRIA